jgi:hypothetical protein
MGNMQQEGTEDIICKEKNMPLNNGIKDQKPENSRSAPLDKAHQSGNRDGLRNDGEKSQHSDVNEQGNQNKGTNNQTGSTRGGSFEHYGEG